MSSVDNTSKPRGLVSRWLVTVILLLVATGVTVAALHWYQPIRERLDSYLGVETESEETLESEDPMLFFEEPSEPIEANRIEDAFESDGTDSEAVELEDLLDIQAEDEPVTISARDPLSAPNPIDIARFELQFALLVAQKNGDLALASNALRRARTIEYANRLSSTFIDAVDRASDEIERLRELDIRSIQARLDELSKLIVSLGRSGSENRPVGDPAVTFRVSEQPEAQSFWRELSDGITNVYQIRRIENSSTVEIETRVETGSELRLLLLIERARRDIGTYDIDSYRESLNEALTALDMLRPSISDELTPIRDELLELMSVELASPSTTIGHALEILADEALTQSTEARGPAP